MGETALTFGPQWLRALSGGHEGGSPPPPHLGSVKYKLAEHRYGREEMLALTSHGSKPPATLDADESFLHSKPRDPLSLETMTEEEAALLHYGVNSDAARAVVRPVAVPVGGGGPGVGGGNGELPGELRGGLGVDRGHRGAIRGGRGAIRGRGGSVSGLRGGMRNQPLEEDPEGKRGAPWGNEWAESRFGGGPNRTRSFERSQSFGERSNWGERNGPTGTSGGPGGDPRRPALPGPPGRIASNTENWRQREGAGDEFPNDWRHQRGQDKWGTGGSSWRDRAGDEDRRGGYAPTRGPWRGPGGRGGQMMRRERGYGDEEEEYDGEEEHYGGNGGGAWPRDNASREEGARHEKLRHGGAGDGPQVSPGGTSSTASPPHSPRSKEEDRANSDLANSGATDSLDKHRGIRPVESPQGLAGKPKALSPELSRKSRPGMNSGDSHHVPTSVGAYAPRPNAALTNAEHPKPTRSPPTSSYLPMSSNARLTNHINAGDASNAQATFGAPGAGKENSFLTSAGLRGVDHGLLDNSRKTITPISHQLEPEVQQPDITWFYRDPAGNVQGPFTNQDMFDWHERGFFRDHLLVRRSMDEEFISLGQMKATFGGNPFARTMQGVMMPPRGGSTGSVGSSGMGSVGAGTSVTGSVLMPHMMGGSSAPGVGIMPSSPLRAHSQNMPHNRVPTGDFLPSQSHPQRLPNVGPGSIGPGGRRLPTDSSHMNLPQFLANIQMNKDAGGSSWKAPGVPPPSNPLSGLSLDERLQSGMPNDPGSNSGLSFLHGLGQQAPIGTQHTNQPPPSHHPGMGSQRMHSATPVSQLLSNVLGPPGPSQPMNVPQVPHESMAEPGNHVLTSLLQKLNMPPPQPPQHSQHSQHPQHPQHQHPQQQQQLPSYLDMGDSKDQKGFGGHGHPILPHQHHGQPRTHLSGMLPGAGLPMGLGGPSQGMGMHHQQQQQQQQHHQQQQQHQQQQHQQQPQQPNDAFQSLLMQLKQQQPPPLVQQPQPNPAEEAALAEDRRLRQEIEKKAKDVEEERKRLEQERLQWEEECRRKQEMQMEEERKRREEEERLKEARRLDEERLEKERRHMAFLQQQRMELEKELERKEAERKKREEEERMQAAMEKKRQEEIQRRAVEAEALRIKLEEEKRDRERRAHEAAELKAKAAHEEAERQKLEELLRQEREEEMEREHERHRGEALRNALLKNATGGVPWGGKGPQQNAATSFLEVQAQEEMERQRRQDQIQLQQTHARVTSPPGGLHSQHLQNDWNSGNVPLRWAAQNRAEPEPKSLAEIQAEEEQKIKQTQPVRHVQHEKKQKPASASTGRATKETAPAPAAAGGVSWASKAASGLPPVPVVATPQPIPKPQNANLATVAGFWSTVTKSSAHAAAIQQQQQQKQQQSQQQAAAIATKANAATQQTKQKGASTKDDENVIKLFENQMPKKRDDEFFKWCYSTLEELDTESSIDVDTFVGFLKDVESPFEVQDYCNSYLGSSKGAREFMKEFLERRSKWRNSMKSAKAPEDSMLGPARAINPNAQTQSAYHSGGPNGSGQNDAFHTVKSKGRNKKNKKMQKVDNSILGFSVTAASDRVNIGDREFIDGM